MTCRKHRGSITVFLCLLLTFVLGLVGACLEYGRAQAVSCQVQLATDAAAESIFAGFHAPLFADYELLGRLIPGGSFDTLEKETLRYVRACQGVRGENGDRGNFLTFQDKEAHWSDVSFLTDQNGKVFSHMASESMRLSGVVILAGEWMGHLGLDRSDLSVTYQENHDKRLEESDFSKGMDNWTQDLRKAEEEAIARAQAADAEAARKAEEAKAEMEAAAERGEEVEIPIPPQGEAMRELNAQRQKGKHLLDMVQDLKVLIDRGALHVVLPKDRTLSAGRIPTSGLPSQLPAGQKSRCVGDAVSGGNALLVREYLLRYLKCFTSETDLSPAYELEYVIAGKSSDEENLKYVVDRMVLIRTALNLAYLAKAPDKQDEALVAATLAVGWTGVAPLIEVTQKIFLAAWALAEACCDVRGLLSGKRVELIKKSENWNLAFENLLADAAEYVAGEDTDDEAKGMSYEDYLRILLYLSFGEGPLYRGMDVIQWSMARLDSDFRMCNCMVAGTLKVEAQTRPVFSVLYGSMGRMRSVSYEKKSSFSYLKAS